MTFPKRLTAGPAKFETGPQHACRIPRQKWIVI